MKFISFFVFLFRNGTLKGKPPDFNQRDAEILQGIPALTQNKKQSLYIRWRNRMVRNPYTGSLFGNLAYLKSLKKINKQYFFVDSLQLCYVRIYKSASTSIIHQLLPLMDSKFKNNQLNDRQVDVLANAYMRMHINQQQRNYIFFTVVRNPFHRLVSVYLDLFNPENHFFGYQSYLFGIFKPTMSFSQFVEVLFKIPDSLKSLHLTSQYQIILSCGGPDKIMCFQLENDSHKLNDFLEQYGLGINHTNKHGINYNYRDYYTTESLQLASIMYADDVTHFNYQEEYDLLAAHVYRDGNITR